MGYEMEDTVFSTSTTGQIKNKSGSAVGFLTSTLLMISCCMVTDSTGYLPAAFSAESITVREGGRKGGRKEGRERVRRVKRSWRSISREG